MIRRFLVLLALLVMMPAAARAQVSLTADRIFLGSAPCLLRTGTGAPSGGRACEFYLNTTTGDLWQNVNGEWRDVTSNPVVDTLTARTSVRTPVIGSSTGALTLDPANGLVLPNRNYGVAFGTPTQRFLTMHLGELWAETLVAQEVMATIGGRVVVAPTTTLEADMSTVSNSVTVKHNNLRVGDIIFMQAAPNGIQKMEFMRVTTVASGTGPYTYTVTRNLDGTGVTAWLAGDGVVNTGTTGNGMIDLFALRGVLTGYGPTIVGNVRTGNNWNDIAPRWAIGNLNNIGYGHSTDLYGAAFGNRSGAYMFLDDGNGLVMAGPGGVRVQITPNGTATFFGDGNGVTNINGGNIATDSITSAQIAANTITVGDMNATGFGDNLIKNGAFEPSVGQPIGSPSGLAGWSKDDSGSNSAVPIQGSCCGLYGPGTLLLDPGAGTFMSAVYQAVPVSAGQTYKVSGRIYADAATSVGYHLIIYEYNGGLTGVRRVINNGGTYPDVARSSYTYLAVNTPLNLGWNDFEFIYQAPADTRWVSLGVYDVSFGGTYTRLHFDDIELTKQIGSGSIKANSLTANTIAAGAITADKFASGTSTNLIRNSECRTSTAEWYPSGNVSASGLSFSYPGIRLLEEPNTCYWQVGGAPSGYHLVYSPHFAVTPGQRYEGSVYLGMHRSSGRVAIEFLNQGVTQGWQYFGNVCTDANGTGGPSITQFCRSGVIATAPAQAASARIWIYSEYAGQNNPYTFYVRAYLGPAMPNQSQLSDWAPAGLTEIIGGIIRTGAITTDLLAADAVIAGKIAAGQITTNHIAAGQVTTNHLNFTAVQNTNVIAYINASAEALVIAGSKIEINGQTTFSAGYNPASKIASGQAALDVNNNVTTIEGGKITANTINGDRIIGNTVNGDRIIGNTLDGNRIIGDTITGNHIQGGAITAGKISVSSLDAITATLGTMNSGTINSGIINGGAINGGEIWAGDNKIHLWQHGIFIDQDCCGGGSARIVYGGITMWGTASSIEINGNFGMSGTLRVDNTGTSNIYGNLQIHGSVYLPNISANVTTYPVYWTAFCQCLTRGGGALAADGTMAPDPVALLERRIQVLEEEIAAMKARLGGERK